MHVLRVDHYVIFGSSLLRLYFPGTDEISVWIVVVYTLTARKSVCHIFFIEYTLKGSLKYHSIPPE